MRAILFDIDGTLIRSAGAGREALNAALWSVFGKSGTGSVEFNGRTDRGIAGDVFELHGIENNLENWLRFRAAYLELLPHHLASRRGRVLPGAVDLLTSLTSDSQTLLGLLTGNTREGARIKLAHFRLETFFQFDVGGFGDDHPHRDDVARDALRKLQAWNGNGHAPGRMLEEIWVVGDTPRDIQCARAIGARVLAVATGASSREELAAHRPDVLAQDLREVAALQGWL